MFAFFLIVFIVPALIGAVAFVLTSEITWQEVLLQVGVQFFIALIAMWVVSYKSLSDVDIVSGRVTGKEKTWVSCSHSYSCNCHTTCSGFGKNRTCSETCSTCYMHSNDWDWNVYSTVGNFTIDRVDSRGSDMPERWRQINVKDPVSKSETYKNYIKASPDSLFQQTSLVERYKNELPEYPGKIYDYYKIDRFLTVDFVVSQDERNWWNKDLNELNADLGKQYQVNVVIVVVKDKPKEWFYALEQSWLGGKKNDAVLVVSVDAERNVKWVEVMAWVKDPIFKVKLRDKINDFKKLNRPDVVSMTRDVVKKFFQRKPMEDFSYLSASLVPSVTDWIITLVVSVIISVILSIISYQRDVFGTQFISTSYRRYR